MSFVRFLGILLATGLAGTFVASGAAQQDFALKASYEREGLPVPQWSFVIGQDGMVDYTSHHAAAGVSDAPVRFHLSNTGATKLGKWLADSHGLQPCETRTKGLARMGMKTLTYTPTGGAASTCTYNFSDNKPMSQAAEYLAQASAVIEEGQTIDRLHRYDRLGLDAVLIRLSAAAKDGRAQEVGAIRPQLESLVADDAVLERVRQRAAQLLELAKQQ